MHWIFHRWTFSRFLRPRGTANLHCPSQQHCKTVFVRPSRVVKLYFLFPNPWSTNLAKNGQQSDQKCAHTGHVLKTPLLPHEPINEIYIIRLDFKQHFEMSKPRFVNPDLGVRFQFGNLTQIPNLCFLRLRALLVKNKHVKEHVNNLLMKSPLKAF